MSTIEIERKFLVTGEFKKLAVKKYKIQQGFLSSVPERTVRVRIRDHQGFLTVKGLGSNNGTSRYEFEKEITLNEATALLAICEPNSIQKTRYIIPTNHNLFFEVDEFHDVNTGLIIAEIELPSEETSFDKPNWLGKEVTGEKKYYNAMLSKIPYKNWD